MKMKPTALALAAGLILCLGSAAQAVPANSARLVLIEDDGKFAGYLAPDSRTRNGAMGQVWELILFHTPKPLGGTTLVGAWMLSEYDCAAQTYRPLELDYLDANFAVAHMSPQSEAAGPIPPESPAEVDFQWVCNDKLTAEGPEAHGLADALKQVGAPR